MRGFQLLLVGIFAIVFSACGEQSKTADAPPQDEPAAEVKIKQTPENAAASLRAAASNLSEAVKWQDIKPGTPQFHYLMGGYHTLAAVEHILQVRYANYSGELPMVPGGQGRIAANPDAKFDPAFVENALNGALVHLERAQKSLDKAVGKDFEVDVKISGLWFDINRNGERDEGEGVLTQVQQMPQFRRVETKDVMVRFDKADANWLAAYVHMLSGMAEMVLATDPTPAIETVTEGRALLLEKGTISATPMLGEDGFVESAAVVIMALRGVPDKTRTRSALAHFKSMIAHNQSFWTHVMAESDDKDEWLPNPDQASAFGPDVTQEMAEGWQEVLVEINDVLEGRKLLPYWRIRNRFVGVGGTDPEPQTAVGINFAKMMTDPGDMDIILLIQGTAVAPYLEEGVLADNQAWRRFSRLTGGQGGLFALWFN